MSVFLAMKRACAHTTCMANIRGIWNWYIIYTDLEGPNPSNAEIPNFEVTPGISAYPERSKFLIIFQGESPGSDARAKIFVIKPMTYGNFVIKYFMSPQNIGENMVGVKKMVFYSPSLYLNKKFLVNHLKSYAVPSMCFLMSKKWDF